MLCLFGGCVSVFGLWFWFTGVVAVVCDDMVMCGGFVWVVDVVVCVDVV